MKKKKNYCEKKFDGEADVVENCVNDYFNISCGEFYPDGSMEIKKCVAEC